MKTKYAVPNWLVKDLITSGMAQDEGAALEKAASGEVLGALLQRKNRDLGHLEVEFKHLGGRGIALAENIESLKSDIEEIKEYIQQCDTPLRN
jgi:hypothetical protein